MMLALSQRTLAAIPKPVDVPQLWAWDTELPGFGACIGRTGSITFYASARSNGEKKKIAIGKSGSIDPKSKQPWTVTTARAHALTLLGALKSGAIETLKPAPIASGPTLREAIAEHERTQRGKGCEEKSIATVRGNLERHLSAWLDRPLAELSGVELRKVYDHTIATATPRKGQKNAPGQALAITLVLNVSAVWNSMNRILEGKLLWNPAKAIVRPKLKPSRERVTDLRAWYRELQVFGERSEIRRDVQLLALFTGLRSASVRTIRHEDIDFRARKLNVPKPKGGVDAAFDTPLGPTAIEILKRRIADNRIAMAAEGGDHGWIFPTTTQRKPIRVIAVVEATAGANGEREMASMHKLRRTYLSIASDLGVSELDRHALANHSFGGHNVNATYISQHFDHLLAEQTRIDVALREKCGMPKLSKRR